MTSAAVLNRSGHKRSLATECSNVLANARLSLREMMIIVVSFHRKSDRPFEHFYQKRVGRITPSAQMDLVSITRDRPNPDRPA